MSKIKILIVDDHAMLRDGIRALLSLHDDFEIVGEAREGKESIEKARECSPDVILMDLAMPGMDGLEATRHIRKENPATRVLALTQHEDREYILSAISAGVTGYIPKRALSSELMTAIRAVHRGETFLSSSAAGALVESYLQRNERDPYDRLTPRERQILKLVTAGHTSRMVGDKLHISFRTVQAHRVKIAKKLGLHDLTRLTKYALRKGLLELETDT